VTISIEAKYLSHIILGDLSISGEPIVGHIDFYDSSLKRHEVGFGILDP
jgi:UDP-3-O-acyl-N-acetylglucosamine deacetylase